MWAEEFKRQWTVPCAFPRSRSNAEELVLTPSKTSRRPQVNSRFLSAAHEPGSPDVFRVSIPASQSDGDADGMLTCTCQTSPPRALKAGALGWMYMSHFKELSVGSDQSTGRNPSTGSGARRLPKLQAELALAQRVCLSTNNYFGLHSLYVFRHLLSYLFACAVRVSVP